MVVLIVFLFIFMIATAALSLALKQSRCKKFGYYRKNGSPADDAADGGETEERFTLKYSALWRYSLLFFAVVGLGIGIGYLALDIGGVWYAAAFFIFAAIAFAVFNLWLRWKVEADADGFVYTNWLGKSREYKFADLKFEIGRNGRSYSFYKGGKKVLSVSWIVKNEEKLQKAYANFVKKKTD